MKIEVEVSESEIIEATHRAVKKAIVDTINGGNYKGGRFKTLLDETVEKVLPKIIEDTLNSDSLKAMVDKVVEAKAKRVISKMVNSK